MPQQYLRRRVTITDSFVMIQGYAIVSAHGIQAVAHIGQFTSPDLNGTTILGAFLPWNAVILQALFQHAHVERSIMSNQYATSKQFPDLLPQFRKCRGIADRLCTVACQPGVEACPS